MGRSKLPDHEKKLRGTFKNQKEQRETIEKVKPIIESFKNGVLVVPQEITDEYVKQSYEEHIILLRHIGHEVNADNPLLDHAYKCLEQARFFAGLLDETDIDDPIYDDFLKRELKLFNEYMRIVQDFFLSPKTRLKLIVDLQAIKESESRIANQEESAIAKLLKQKES